jgi:hypothetical protein
MNLQATILYFVTPQQLLDGALLFCVVIAVIISFVLLYLVKRTKRAGYRKILREHFSDLISQLAICESEEEIKTVIEEISQRPDFRLWMNDSYARHILVKELVTGVKSVSGSSRENICSFYTKMNLEADTLNRLKNNDWHVKAKAIQVLSHLEQKKHITRIYRLTNSKNELVRHEARIAVVKLTGFDGLRFLDIISYPITEWQQLHLLHELSKQDKTDFTAIDKWLHSSNQSVAEFALRLVEEYRIYDLHDEVAALLVHPAELVRLKAIQSICEIRGENTSGALLKNFESQSPAVQFAIVKALQQTGTQNDIAFLTILLRHERDDFKMAAARALRNIDITGFSIIEKAINKTVEPWPVLLPQLLQEERE